jgi:hypothetical protein
VQLNVLRIEHWNLHLGAVLGYAPRESVIFSHGSVIVALSSGIQRWPLDGGGVGLFVDGGVDVGKQVRGSAEGDGEDELFAALKLHLGMAF